MDTQELLRLRNTIAEQKKKGQELKARRKLLTEQLSRDFQCDSVDQANPQTHPTCLLYTSPSPRD